ncbi:MAG: hypothetical protein ABQ298_03120 [Puniceicoccaceae bacterium]
MKAIVDFHVHFYPQYGIESYLHAFCNRTQPLLDVDDHQCLTLMCLVERQGQYVFNQLESGHITLNSPWQVAPLEPGRSLKISCRDHTMILIAGRQFVTAERIEMLCLGVDLDQPDGLNSEQLFASIQAAKGLPVVAWAPGKWMFKRRRVVQALLNHASPQQIALGDTSLRPRYFSGGTVFSKALRSGYVILPGSDPLPFSGESTKVGSYFGITDLNPDTPAASLWEQFHTGTLVVQPSRRPNSILGVMNRMIAHTLAKRSQNSTQ